MLDRRTGELLKRINGLCKTSAFCIIEEEDLLSEGVDADGVKGMLGYLQDRGYLEMRYADGGEYCLCVLPEGRRYFERVAAEKKEALRRERRESLCVFFGALLGAFLGGGLVALVAAVM